MAEYANQVVALKYLTKKYGTQAFAEEHENYKRVGLKREGKKPLTAIGDTWDEAIRSLEERVDQQ